MFRRITKESLSSEQAGEISKYLISVISKHGDVYNLKKDQLRSGLLNLSDCERSQPTRYMHSVALFIKESYPLTPGIDDILSCYLRSPSTFSTLINGNCHNWNRYFNLADKNLVAKNYADSLFSIWSSNLSRSHLQNKISKSISNHFELTHGSIPQHAAVAIILGLTIHGLTLVAKDDSNLYEVASRISNHPLKAAAFCPKGISQQLIIERTSGLVTTRTTASYWCEIHLKIEKNDIYTPDSKKEVIIAAINHFKDISKEFTEKLSLMKNNLMDMHPLKIRDIINALFIKWEFEVFNIEENIPLQTARVLGAKTNQPKSSTINFKVNNFNSFQDSVYKKITHEMPIWDQFDKTITEDIKEVNQGFDAKFNRLTTSKQKLILEMMDALAIK
jgi:hypothetical protein